MAFFDFDSLGRLCSEGKFHHYIRVGDLVGRLRSATVALAPDNNPFTVTGDAEDAEHTRVTFPGHDAHGLVRDHTTETTLALALDHFRRRRALEALFGDGRGRGDGRIVLLRDRSGLLRRRREDDVLAVTENLVDHRVNNRLQECQQVFLDTDNQPIDGLDGVDNLVDDVLLHSHIFLKLGIRPL
jgi:hypothetical protein